MDISPVSKDFLAQRQAARSEYFKASRGQEATKKSGAAPTETKEASKAATPAATVDLSSAASKATATQGTGQAKAAAAAPADPIQAKRKEYGSFYQSSPNGSRLAELRSRNEDMMKKYQNPQQ